MVLVSVWFCSFSERTYASSFFSFSLEPNEFTFSSVLYSVLIIVDVWTLYLSESLYSVRFVVYFDRSSKILAKNLLFLGWLEYV